MGEFLTCLDKFCVYMWVNMSQPGDNLFLGLRMGNWWCLPFLILIDSHLVHMTW
jgi:hypothetical protein